MKLTTRSLRRLSLVAAGAFALSSCATPESRIQSALVELGLPAPISKCMAGRMADRLSTGQLYKLSKMSSLSDQKVRELSLAEFLRRTKALQDPEILAIVSTAGIRCSLKF